MTTVEAAAEPPRRSLRFRVAPPSEGYGWRRDLATFALIAAVGVVAWLLLNNLNAAHVQILALVLAWAIATNGLNVIVGLAGYPSLLQGAFYGIGAYGSSKFLEHHVNFWLGALLTILMAAAAGLAVGAFFARTRGQYFAIGTLFCSVVFTLLIQNSSSLGGSTGMGVGLGIPSVKDIYIAYAVCLSASLALFHVIGRIRFGRRLRSIRADEDLAEHVGVPTGRIKLAGFVVAAAVGAVGGILFAQYNGTIAPDVSNYSVSFLMFVAVGVGGPGRLLGPLLGSIFVAGFPAWVHIGSGFAQLVVGLVFVYVTILTPAGFVGMLDLAGRGLRRLVPERTP